jgi:hypothetical protein
MKDLLDQLRRMVDDPNRPHYVEVEKNFLREIIKKLDDHIDLDKLFDTQWKADRRAINRWQEANPGHDRFWPDRADMVVWLMEQYDARAQSPLPVALRETISNAIMKVVSNRDDLGNTHFVEIRDVIFDAITPFTSTERPHDSDCAVNNAPALPVGPCNCSVSSAHRCQKCGTSTKGEEVYVDGQIWCHPCADRGAK